MKALYVAYDMAVEALERAKAFCKRGKGGVCSVRLEAMKPTGKDYSGKTTWDTLWIDIPDAVIIEQFAAKVRVAKFDVLRNGGKI